MTYKLFIFVILVFAPIASFAGGYEPFDVVLDIDETTFGRYVDPAQTGIAPRDYVSDDRGRMWRVLHGLPEVLLALERLGARVSFFSGYYKPERNPQILQNLLLPDGRNAYELINGRVRGAYEIEYVNGHKRKNLSLLKPRRLTRVILVDNEVEYSFPGQEKNLLWVPTLNIDAFENADVNRFDMVLHLIGREQYKSARTYLAKIEREYLFDENKPIVMLGLIARALEKSEAEKISLRDAVSLLQWDALNPPRHAKESYFANESAVLVNLEKGLEIIRQYVDPYFEPMNAFEGMSQRDKHRRKQILAKLSKLNPVDHQTQYHEECLDVFARKSYR